MKNRIVVGITGASGIEIAYEVLSIIKEGGTYESHLIISESGKRTVELESRYSVQDILKQVDFVYDNKKIESSIASGSFQTDGMIIVPCSMKTVAGIASGYSDSLLLRAADVTLKERRKLVLAVRECPFNGIHLRNMKELWDMGAEIMPLMMTFYNKPVTIHDMVHHIACKIVEKFGIVPNDFQRWEQD